MEKSQKPDVTAQAIDGNGKQVIAAAGLLCFVLGSVHAFSVFLAPLETIFSVSRANVSLIYSLSLISLTISVLLGPKFYSRLLPGSILLASGLVAAAGTLIAAFAPGLSVVLLGYGILFGAANGAGYGFGLQIAAKANAGREGMAMGIITACYAIGTIVAPFGFQWALSHGGFRLAMIGLGVALVAGGLLSALIIRNTAVRMDRPDAHENEAITRPGETALLWAAYGSGVFSGLMVIGHAAEIARSDQLASLVWMAPALIAGFNLLGSLLGGYLADVMSSRTLLRGLTVIASAVLTGLALITPGPIVLAGLAAIGFCYGATISIYPSIIAKRYGMTNGPRLYGRVFTAWGAAGLAAPWLAGFLFDIAGNYSTALLTAAALSLASAVIAHVVFGGEAPRHSTGTDGR